MAGVTLQGDWSKFDRHLERLANCDFTGMHKEIGEALVSSVQDRFRSGMGPDGKRWPKSARAKAEGGKTLVDTRDLKGSVTYRAGPAGVEVGTNKIYGAIHQYGGTIVPKRRKLLRFAIADKVIFAKKVEIPARPFLGISVEDQAEIAEIVQRRIEETAK